MIELEVEIHDPLVLAKFGAAYSIPAGPHTAMPTTPEELIPNALSDRLEVFRDGRRDYGFTIRRLQIEAAS